MSYIKSICLCFPENIYSQQEVFEKITEVLPRWKDKKAIANIYKNAMIDRRAFAIPLAELAVNKPLTPIYKATVFESSARSLGTRAGRAAIRDAGLEPDDIDAILTVTSTGFLAPSLSSKIALDIGLPANVLQVPSVGWGCCGGVLGLSLAHDLVHAGYRHILLVNVELSSTAFLQSDVELRNFVATALFADGAAGTIVSADNTNALVKILAHHCTLIPDTEYVMGWATKNDGLQVIFGADVPEVAEKNLQGTIDNVLKVLNWDKTSVQHWLPHPGGTKVLTVFERILDTHLTDAWDTLREHGNMSSVTVLAVLLRASQNGRRGESIVSAMGPGFNIAHIGAILL